MKCIRDGWKLGWFERISYVLLVTFYCFSKHASVLAFDNSNNTFVERSRVDCSLRKDIITCGKYKVARWLHDIVREKEYSYGSLRIVRIPSISGQPILPKLPQSRVFKTDAVEALNFVRDCLEDLLTKRALVYTVDNSATGRSFGSAPMIMDEDELIQMQSRKYPADNWRLLKKKTSIILPLLILLNLLKVKLLLLPIFLGVHFIKKLLVLASIIVPSLLARLKICKFANSHYQGYPYHMWGTAADTPVDYPTAYGQEEPWSHRSDYVSVNSPYMGYQGYRNPYG
ncbi:uncharacterized protein LOC105681894 [Bombus impatiens]|uniref:Uncharacterized protein LOC105681894 n=1 Tax=Bombus impatiens TaxID=132113 RepID=A0A6P3V5J9_BOMIM|nr:uncharacterized protein LOC105681894 [Bombus impatiens]